MVRTERKTAPKPSDDPQNNTYRAPYGFQAKGRGGMKNTKRVAILSDGNESLLRRPPPEDIKDEKWKSLCQRLQRALP